MYLTAPEPSTTQQVLDMLKVVAAKLGTTTEYLWGVLIKQGWFEIVQRSILIVMLPIVATMLFKRGAKIIKERHDLFDIGVLGCIVAIIMYIIAAYAFFTLKIPEAYALERVLELFK